MQEKDEFEPEPENVQQPLKVKKEEDEVKFEVLFKQEGAPDEVRHVAVKPDPEGRIDIFSFEQFGLGPSLDNLDPRFSRGFTRPVIGAVRP